MRWRGGKRYGNIEDRRGVSAGRAGGGISIGAIAIVLIGYFVFGVDPATLIGVVQQGQGGYSTQQARSEEHTSELQSRENLVCRLLLEKKKHKTTKLKLA